jgi:uncharacterized phage protein (TIGR02220 family)
MKLTKRKGFNFFRSYFDVYNELEKDSDKVAFINALLSRQFLGIKPDNLKGMAKFAYISQTNSIDSQVRGYEDKTRTKLNPLEENNYTPAVGGSVGGAVTPALQVEVEEKVEVNNNTVPLQKAKGLIDFDSLLMFLNLKTGKNLRIINKATRQKFNERLKDKYTKDDIKNAITNACKDTFHKENGFKHLTPDYFSRAKSLDLHAFKKINGVAKAEINPYFPKN